VAGTLNIPLTTLNPGTRDFGPVAVSDADSTATITINRAVVGGLNSVSSSVSISIEVNESDDGGASWFNLASSLHIGSPAFDNPKQPGVGSVKVNFAPGTGRQVKATVIVLGGSVAVSGNLNMS